MAFSSPAPPAMQSPKWFLKQNVLEIEKFICFIFKIFISAFSTWYSDGSQRNKITLLPWYSALIYSKMICLFDIVRVMENMARVTSCPLNVNCLKMSLCYTEIHFKIFTQVFFSLFSLSSLITYFHLYEEVLESGTFPNEE